MRIFLGSRNTYFPPKKGEGKREEEKENILLENSQPVLQLASYPEIAAGQRPQNIMVSVVKIMLQPVPPQKARVHLHLSVLCCVFLRIWKQKDFQGHLYWVMFTPLSQKTWWCYKSWHSEEACWKPLSSSRDVKYQQV